MKRIAILQSNYIPWKGYFDLINSVDEFIVYDDAQYTKRDWRNRNLIKTKNGLQWLTVPVEVKHKYKQAIKDAKISDFNWSAKHLKNLRYNYSKAECYNEMIDWINEIFNQCAHEIFLSDINLILIRKLAEFLGIKTKISFSSDYIIEGNRTEKLLNMCIQAGADEYLSGPAAKSYMDLSVFEKERINVAWMNYSGYSEYIQSYPPFVHGVSIMDLILNNGHKSVNYLNTKVNGTLEDSISFSENNDKMKNLFDSI